jgi:hypothetical protein
LYHSVGGMRVREIVSQIVYPKNRRGSIKTNSQLV